MKRPSGDHRGLPAHTPTMSSRFPDRMSSMKTRGCPPGASAIKRNESGPGVELGSLPGPYRSSRTLGRSVGCLSRTATTLTGQGLSWTFLPPAKTALNPGATTTTTARKVFLRVHIRRCVLELTALSVRTSRSLARVGCNPITRWRTTERLPLDQGPKAPGAAEPPPPRNPRHRSPARCNRSPALGNRSPDGCINNVVRTTVQALAAVLGGTQSLHTNSYDEALGLPSEAAALLALRTQQVMAHESGVADVADPLAGSYLVESMTAELETLARDMLERIRWMGGMLEAIDRGWVQEKIHRSAYRWQREVESGERVVVGVNRYVEGAMASPTFQHDPEIETQRARFLAGWRRERDAQVVESAMARLQRDAQGTANLVPAILDALKARATLGEVCDTLRAVFGSYRPVVNA